MPLEKYVCALSNKLFFEPVYLSECKHIFEKESLLDKLDEKTHCPHCDISIKNKNQIQFAKEISKEISKMIQIDPALASKQYLPRYLLFDLLTEKKLSMPLSQIETLLKQEHQKQTDEENAKKVFNSIFLDQFTSKKEKLIVYALHIQPERMAYFLWQSIQESMLIPIVKKLLKMGVFNETTINQSLTQKVSNQQMLYSVSYLLVSNVEGRVLLKENTALCTLIGEKLSEKYIQQFVCENTHEGTLYYLLTDEAGQTIVKQHTSLQEKIKKLDKAVLTKTIVSGFYQGRTLKSLYKEVLSFNSSSSYLAFSR